MARVRAGLACPLCDIVGVTSELYAEVPGTKVSCETGNEAHQWTDTLELRQLKPRMVQLPKRAEAPQANHVKFEISVPENTRKALEQKYGDRVGASISSLLQAAAEPEMLIMSSADIDRIGQRLGKRPQSSSELFGMIFQLGEDLKALHSDKEQLEKSVKLGRSTNVTDGVAVNLGAWTMKAMIKANENGMSMEEFLSKYLQDALENDWIS